MCVPEINKTMDYNKFKFADFNRDISKSNVNKLKKEYNIKNNFKYFPIVVDKDFKIIDGQHRFMACKDLNEPIYYIRTNDTINPMEVRTVNKAGKKHSLKDVFMMDLKVGNSEAIKINNIFETYSGKIALSVVIAICLDRYETGSLKTAIESGNYSCVNESFIKNICKGLLTITQNTSVNNTIYNTLRGVCKKNKIELLSLISTCVNRGLYLNSKYTKSLMISKIVDSYNYRKRVDRIEYI